MKAFFITLAFLIMAGSIFLSGFTLYEYFSSDQRVEENSLRFSDENPLPQERVEVPEEQPLPESLKKEEVWDYLTQKAEERGYQKQTEATAEELTYLYEIPIHQDAYDDLHNMFMEAAKEGVKINFISGHRSSQTQENIFFHKLGSDFSTVDILEGRADEKIDSVLAISSFPGYSKHHTGKAVDLSCGEETKLNYGFAETNCYQWLATDDFANAKKYNFHPSYPVAGENMGPNPEPWEFIWQVDPTEV